MKVPWFVGFWALLWPMLALRGLPDGDRTDSVNSASILPSNTLLDEKQTKSVTSKSDFDVLGNYGDRSWRIRNM